MICIAFYIEGTGLTRVMEMLAEHFSQRYHVHYIGVGYHGDVIQEGDITIYPTNLHGGDIMGAYQARDLIEEIRPSFVFILHDIWHFERYMDVFKPVQSFSKIVGYIPLDGEITDPQMAVPLMDLDMVVLYTPWAQNEVQCALNKVSQEGDRLQPFVEVAYHGVELEHFYRIKEKSLSERSPKDEVFPGLGEDAFVVLNASRPCIRKRVDITLRGFAQFAQGKPGHVKLCLHQAIREEESEHLRLLADELGILDRIVMNPLNGRAKEGDVLSNRDLNLLYNACDVGINTSMGEGWGLVSFEHAVTGAAQIVPAHSACQFLWDGAAVMLETVPSSIPPISPLGMREPTLDGVAVALEQLYMDRDYRYKVASLCKDLAYRACYRWESIAEVWHELLAKLEDKSNPVRNSQKIPQIEY